MELDASETLAGAELDPGDELIVRLAGGRVHRIVLKSAWAGVRKRGPLPYADLEGVISYCISCMLDVDGQHLHLSRVIPSQNNFRRPSAAFGMHIWLDAVDDIFTFLNEEHGTCRPHRKCRLAVWDARGRICPMLLHPWCPLPSGKLRLEKCYRGEDTWLGPYSGAECHGGW